MIFTYPTWYKECEKIIRDWEKFDAKTEKFYIPDDAPIEVKKAFDRIELYEVPLSFDLDD